GPLNALSDERTLVAPTTDPAEFGVFGIGQTRSLYRDGVEPRLPWCVRVQVPDPPNAGQRPHVRQVWSVINVCIPVLEGATMMVASDAQVRRNFKYAARVTRQPLMGERSFIMRCPKILIGLAGAVVLLAVQGFAASPAIKALRLEPSSVVLKDARDERRVLVLGKTDGDKWIDLTSEAKLRT